MPTGTASSTVSPSAPCLRAPRPGSPRPALNVVFARNDGEVAEIGVGDEHDVAAAAAVAAVGPALRHVLLAPEAQAAVAAAARQHLDAGAIVEHAQAAEVSALGEALRAAAPRLTFAVGLGDRDEALLAGRAELDRALADGEDRVVTADARARARGGTACRAGAR